MPPATPRLTVQELRKRGLLAVLAKAFNNRHDADELLDALDFPQERRRDFEVPLHYWTDACGEIEKGVTHGGLEALLQAVRELRPSLLEVPTDDAREKRGRDLTGHYFVAQRAVVDQHGRHFVGRADVDRSLTRFIARQPRGYFIVRGGPGQGKSAVAAHLVRSRSLPHHFVSRTGGRSDPRLILRSLLAQLLPPLGGEADLPEGVAELTKLLEDSLARLADRRPVLVIDALDELPPEAGPETPFLVTDALPDGVFVVVTSRPGGRLDHLLGALSGVPYEEHELAPLALDETAELLRSRQLAVAPAEVERIAEVAQGNPLYLRAVGDELERDPGFDLGQLPARIEGFFGRATADLRHDGGPLLRDVLGLLATARKPLSLRELNAVTGVGQRDLDERGVRPVRQFLLEVEGGYCFYHARFHDFVTRELLYEDELAGYHRALAAWLRRPESRSSDYRRQSLSHHLYHGGERERLPELVTAEFLADKVRRSGYAVLEDVELLARAMLEAGDPALVERCVGLVERLRAVVGGDVIEQVRQAMRGKRPGPAAIRSNVTGVVPPSVPGVDVYAATLPKVEVGADFFEVVPCGDRVVLAIGDAPGTGLKSAFVARFIGNVFRHLVKQANPLHLGDLLGELNRVLSANAYFDVTSMQCATVAPREGELAIASAGHPYPVLYSARRGKCDRLPISGDLLNTPTHEEGVPVRYEQRRAEIEPGDVLVLITDGLTEDNRIRGDRYGYRFTRLVEENAGLGAKALGEAILDDWLAYPRKADDADDVTVVVVSMGAVKE